MDAETGTILFQHEADTPMPPASMAKLMTMAVVFDALRSRPPQARRRIPGQRICLAQGRGAVRRRRPCSPSSVPPSSVSDLLRGTIVQSGNDACIILAEGMAGSEATFADMMNAQGEQAGADRVALHQCHGTARSRTERYGARSGASSPTISSATYPEFYKIYGEPDFTWNKIYAAQSQSAARDEYRRRRAEDRLHRESGYGLVGSAVRDGHRLIVVINGTKTDKERAEEARKLLDWGFSAFERMPLFRRRRGRCRCASVFGGDADGRSALVGQGAARYPAAAWNPRPREGADRLSRARSAPVKEGQEFGVARVSDRRRSDAGEAGLRGERTSGAARCASGPSTVSQNC